MLNNCDLGTTNGGIDLDQHWLKYRLRGWRHQAITLINIDLRAILQRGSELLFHNAFENYAFEMTAKYPFQKS